MPANPALTQLRVGFEATAGYGDPAAFQDVRLLSETLGSDIPIIQDESIIDSAEMDEGYETKIIPGGDINVNWSPEDHVKFLANFFGKGKTAVQAPTGVWTHKLAISETDITFDRLAVEISRDLDNILATPVKRPEMYVGALASQLTWASGPRSFLNGAITLVTPRFHFLEDATVLTGTGTDPVIRGFHKYSGLGSADGDIFVKVDSIPAATMDIICKVSAAAAYGTTKIVITPLTWTELTDEGDLRIGDTGIPVEILWPNLTGVVNLDEWRFDRERAIWTQSLAAAAVLNEVDIEIQLDGTKFRTRDFSLTATRPAEPDESIGGRFLEVDQVNEFGQRTVAGQLNRRALDTALVDRLLRREPFSLTIDARGPEIGSTGSRRQMILTMKNCIPSGRTPSVGGAGSFDEPIDFMAHPSSDGTYPSALTVELVNSQADLTA